MRQRTVEACTTLGLKTSQAYWIARRYVRVLDLIPAGHYNPSRRICPWYKVTPLQPPKRVGEDGNRGY